MLLGIVGQSADLVVLRSLYLILLDIVAYDADKLLSMLVGLLYIDTRNVFQLL